LIQIDRVIPWLLLLDLPDSSLQIYLDSLLQEIHPILLSLGSQYFSVSKDHLLLELSLMPFHILLHVFKLSGQLFNL
jgi:hypothetical protein